MWTEERASLTRPSSNSNLGRSGSNFLFPPRGPLPRRHWLKSSYHHFAPPRSSQTRSFVPRNILSAARQPAASACSPLGNGKKQEWGQRHAFRRTGILIIWPEKLEPGGERWFGGLREDGLLLAQTLKLEGTRNSPHPSTTFCKWEKQFSFTHKISGASEYTGSVRN